MGKVHTVFKREDSKGFHGVDIQGKLEDIFFDISLTVSNGEELAQQLVGKPINDSDGNFIGKITGVDYNKGLWYGRILIEDSLRELVLDEYTKSISMVMKQE